VAKWAAEGATQIVYDGIMDTDIVKAHCRAYDLQMDRYLNSVRDQLKRWTIDDFWPRAAIRREFPDYRRPPWDGPTLLIDSLWLLDI